MGFGTFDGVHPGHLFFLNELKKLGDELIVIIARDSNVKKIKGRLPHLNDKARHVAVEATGVADRVVLGDEKDFYRPIKDHRPAVIGIGYDQQADLKALKLRFPDIKLTRIVAYEPDKYKSSLIKKG